MLRRLSKTGLQRSHKLVSSALAAPSCVTSQGRQPSFASALFFSFNTTSQHKSLSSQLRFYSSTSDTSAESAAPQEKAEETEEKRTNGEAKEEKNADTDAKKDKLEDVSDQEWFPAECDIAQFSREALKREKRDQQIAPFPPRENYTYDTILWQKDKNIYDFMDDMPKPAKPLLGNEHMQQREHFRQQRDMAPLHIRVATYAGWALLIGAFAFTVSLTSVWIEQPKEVAQLRHEILGNTYGKVLELAAGQGMNVGNYPYAVHEIVMVDDNAQELDRLLFRLPQSAYPKYVIQKETAEHLSLFKDGEFDCVVDMFGLCHYRDPIMALRQMQRVVKPTGSIVLLEHGRSPYFFVNWFLDWFAEKHEVNTHGCRWNLPIRDYMKKARLEVKELRNLHYGTTYYVIAYPEVTDAAPATN